MCRRTADEIKAARTLNLGACLLLTPRPQHGMGEYLICVDCKSRVIREQNERAQEAIRIAERAGA